MIHSIIRKAGFALALTVGCSSLALALPADFMDKLQAESRPEADKARDGARRPAQVLTLLGIQEGWTVVDVSAGGGWYTRVLSAAVGPNGKVLSQVGERPLQRENGKAQKDLAAQLGNVETVFAEMSAIPKGTADAAVTAMNFHDQYNFRGEDGAQAFLKGIFDALKSGGVAAIIDHEGTMGMDNASLHRLPVEIALAQIEKAGFNVVTVSDLLHTNADTHEIGSHDAIFGRNTDRFLILVKKP